MTNDTDIDNDGDTDALDFARVRMAFWTKNPEGDVNHDGKVNAIDIALTRAAMFPVAVGTPQWDAEEEICFASFNDYRAHPERWLPYTNQQGVVVEPDRTKVLQPLQRGFRLSQAAQWHAKDMADKNYTSHTDSLGRDAGARIVAFWYEARYTYMGEIALGTDGGGPVAGGYHSFVRWTLSPGHNGIMLSPYVSVGIGHAVRAENGAHRWSCDFSSGVDGWP